MCIRDRLIVLPNGTPPHKEKRINELNKIKLVNLALSHINNLIIDEREILKRSPSYAYLTLKEIQKENPNDTLVWIMGMDSFLEIETWYEYENFLEEVNLLILERPGYEVDETSYVQNLLESKRILNFQEFKDSKGKIFILPIDPIEVTSTNFPVIIAGDLNILYESSEYKIIDSFVIDNNLLEADWSSDLSKSKFG